VKRKLRWLLILLILAAFAVWLEPTRVVWGKLRGDEFYRGRPTSYWHNELDRWRPGKLNMQGGGEQIELVRTPTWLQRRLPWLLPDTPDAWPAVLDGDPAAQPVLRALLDDDTPLVRELAQEGLSRIRTGEQGPRLTRPLDFKVILDLMKK